MLISSTMVQRLNDQMMAEFGAAQKYLAMACAFDRLGLRILRDRFIKQQDEERQHAMRFLKYLQDVGAEPVIDAMTKPRTEYSGVEAIVQAALDSEMDITRRIHELVAVAEQEKDYSTRSFLQWFVTEQVEEVAQMSELLRLVHLAQGNMLALETRLAAESGGEDDEESEEDED